MAIRITGMYSGLDTESIINELASAQSYKKNKLVKAQTKLSWKQDAWKALNTKIYSFYQKLDDLRFQYSYKKLKTVVSNPNAIQVTGKTEGTHKVSVGQLSQRATVTSGKLNDGKDYNYSGSATLKQLGVEGSGSIRLSDNNGAYVDVDINENMSINDFVKKLGNNTALTASFDQDQQRIYLTSWASGKEGDFYLSGNDEVGLQALKSLKLLSTNDIDKLTAAGSEYDVWSKYRDGDMSGTQSAEYLKLIKEETLSRLQAMKAENDELAKKNKNCDKANQENINKLKEVLANADGKYDAYTSYVKAVEDGKTMDAAYMKEAGKELYDKIYGTETQQRVQSKNEDGTPMVDGDGNPVYEQAKNEDGSLKFEDDGITPVYETKTVRTGGMVQDLENLQKDLTDKKDALAKARKDLEADSGNAELQQAVKDAEDAVTAASEAVSKKQTEIGKAKEIYSVYSAYDINEKDKQANQAKIDANNERFTYDEATKTYKEKLKVVADDSDPENVIYTFEEKAVGEGTTAKEVTARLDKKVAVAKDMMDAAKRDALKAEAENMATKVDGEDAVFKVDGVEYKSSTDTLTVNGMTIKAMAETDKDVNVSTKIDTEGVYDTIKGFIKAYSELINEMDSLYNAESAKDYEPLLSEEKEALSENEIEEWEKKIKDSLLRRDSTLRDVSSAMKMDMMSGFSIGGQMVYLSDFGIATLGYFGAADNEKNAYHIDGDPDDEKTKKNADMLKKLIENNPDAVAEFFTGLTEKLHVTLQKKMGTSSVSSAMTFYNDKKMKSDYDDYTDKIKKQEDKLNSFMDKWYAKFSKMETALSKLESKNSSLSSLFGG